MTLTMGIIEAAIQGLEAKKLRISSQIAELRGMISAGAAASGPSASAPTTGRRKFSAATRKRMREAQQRRWAKVRGETAIAAPAKPKVKRKLSADARAAMAAAAKKRWAEFNAAKGKA